MKTFKDIIEGKKKTWKTKVGSGAGKDWKIKRAWIENGDVFIEFETSGMSESEEFDEMTVAGTGVGSYSAPLGISKREDTLLKFGRTIKNMPRKDMLCHCRKMGLSLNHLCDDDLRKSLDGMSLRNKRKFMGSSMGMGMGSIDRWSE